MGPQIHLNLYDLKDPINVSEKITYVIEIPNDGNIPCEDIIVKNFIPEEMEYVQAEGPTKHKVKNNVVIFHPVKILVGGKKLVYPSC